MPRESLDSCWYPPHTLGLMGHSPGAVEAIAKGRQSNAVARSAITVYYETLMERRAEARCGEGA
ncbi:MAG: hypothetical protein NT093_00300 [Candidatus Moranbacteria bacterium]|nr:hypothetical protein [Candidatus Moranbacteria bacterium]